MGRLLLRALYVLQKCPFMTKNCTNTLEYCAAEFKQTRKKQDNTDAAGSAGSRARKLPAFSQTGATAQESILKTGQENVIIFRQKEPLPAVMMRQYARNAAHIKFFAFIPDKLNFTICKCTFYNTCANCTLQFIKAHFIMTVQIINVLCADSKKPRQKF